MQSILLILVFVIWSLFSVLWPEVATYRFLYTVKVSLNGEIKSASSVVEVDFTRRIEAFNYDIKIKGVSPIIVLSGGKGWLIPLIEPQWDRLSKQAPNQKYSEAGVGGVLFKALVPAGADIGKWQRVTPYFESAVKMSLPDNLRPMFAWVPEDATSYEDVQQVFSHEFQTKISPDLSYVGVELEPTKAPLVETLPLNEPWFRSMKDNRYPAGAYSRAVYPNSMQTGERR